jgi:tetratricopeptide (TPR) repeat protein
MLARDNSEYEKALIVFEKMLAFEMDHLQRSNIQRRIGDNCLEIIKQKNDLKICEHAIAAYEKALLVYTQEQYPILRARVMRSLGFVYAALADLVNRAKNLKQATLCWEEFLTIFSLIAATSNLRPYHHIL